MSRRQEDAERGVGSAARRKLALAGAVVAIGIAVSVIGSSVGLRHSPRERPANPRVDQSLLAVPVLNSVPLARYDLQPKTLEELLALPADELAKVDVARMNLLCAKGLPGAEKLDIEHALTTLDAWARRVRFETERHLYRVTDPRYAEHYRRSEAYFRAEMLLQVLQQDLGVKYDMAAVGTFSFSDSRVAFIHGMVPAPGRTLSDTPGGTCASMPVLYVAIGRRLGYPLKLSTTVGHVFVRWEGEGHVNPAWRRRFNIEGSGDGFSSYDDEHYKTWPKRVTEQDVRANGYLTSLMPAEELAGFLGSRGHCGIDNGQGGFAARCFENAYRYDPSRPVYRAWFADAALVSDYRPITPALADLLDQRRRIAAHRRASPELDYSPPSAMARAAPDLPGVPPRLPVGPQPLQPLPSAPNPAPAIHMFKPPTPPRQPARSEP